MNDVLVNKESGVRRRRCVRFLVCFSRRLRYQRMIRWRNDLSLKSGQLSAFTYSYVVSSSQNRDISTPPTVSCVAKPSPQTMTNFLLLISLQTGSAAQIQQCVQSPLMYLKHPTTTTTIMLWMQMWTFHLETGKHKSWRGRFVCLRSSWTRTLGCSAEKLSSHSSSVWGERI